MDNPTPPIESYLVYLFHNQFSICLQLLGTTSSTGNNEIWSPCTCNLLGNRVLEGTTTFSQDIHTSSSCIIPKTIDFLVECVTRFEQHGFKIRISSIDQMVNKLWTGKTNFHPQKPLVVAARVNLPTNLHIIFFVNFVVKVVRVFKVSALRWSTSAPILPSPNSYK